MVSTQNSIPQHKHGAYFRLKPLSACIKAVIAGGALIGAPLTAEAELPIASQNWVTSGSATREVIGSQMNINQETQRAILNWQKFNISADSSVNFKQPSASAIALNRIFDGNPSQILGSLKANGQVYLVNQNGFVFGKDSVVNTRGMVASTLDVTDQTFNDGITKVAEIDQRAAFQGSGEFYRTDENGNRVPIKIDIAKGAKIDAAEGGRILMVAPTIENKGDVNASGGQVVMAAATDKVYLLEAPTDDGADNSDVRGILVEVATGGKVENLGNISANRGNVTLMGFAVSQAGRVSATTTTNVNGTVRLLAREGGSAVRLPGGNVGLQAGTTTRSVAKDDGLGKSATVTLASGSRTEILPEVEYEEKKVTLDSGETVTKVTEKTAIDAQKQPQSRVEIMANKVHLEADSEIVAPGGKVEVTATASPSNPVADDSAKNDSRILVDAGAKIDVAGLTSSVKKMESNVIEVELRNYELKDAPLQKDGILKGKTVSVDIREGTPLTDIQPAIDGIKRKIDERIVEGGQIRLRSEGDVIIEKGAVLDFSGGAVTFLDGFINSTKLISNGRLIDISEADPLLTYDGIYGEVVKKYEKWGVTNTWSVDGPFSLGRFEKGYVEGHDAGSLVVKGHNVILDGDLKGHVINGKLQRELADQARGGSLLVDNGFTFTNNQGIEFTDAQNGVDLGIGDTFPLDGDGAAVALSIEAGKLIAGGIQDAVFKSNGKTVIADNAQVALVDGGSLMLQAGAIEVRGDIKGKGANVSLETVFTSGFGLDGDITVADGASIRLQGEWVNDFVNPENLDGKSVAIDGGKFSVFAGGNAGGDINIQAGSLIDVSGGAWLQADRKLRAGSAGEIVLASKPEIENAGANVILDGVLNAYGLGQGGRFVAVANAVVIRKEEVQPESEGLQPLQIGNDFFSKGGFGEYEFTSNLHGLTVEDDANIHLVPSNRELNTGFVTQANAEDIGAFSHVTILPPELRAPSKLTLRSDHSAGSTDLDSRLTVAAGAVIDADDLSRITLESDSSLVFDGSIKAHGGDVALTVTPDRSSSDPKYRPEQGIWVGASANIDVSGSKRVLVDALGRRSGDVFDGGTVAIDAQRGFVALQDGSSIDVSGTQATLDLPTLAPNAGINYVPTLIGSHGGTIAVSAAEGALLEGNMLAKAGAAPGTSGGKLSLIVDTLRRGDPDADFGSTFPSGQRAIIVSQQPQSAFSEQFNSPGDVQPSALNGKAFVAASQVNEAGFSSLDLAVSGENGEIRFQDDVKLHLDNAINLEAVKFGWESNTGAATGAVALDASRVTLGSDVFRTSNLNPVDGGGQLTVNADLIDLVGASVTQGFNSVNLTANGDIRLIGIRSASDQLDFVGQFKTYSKLKVTADQVYPTSLSNFTLAVSGDTEGTVTFAGNGGAGQPVLSALGKMTVQAPNIVQNGVIKAPFGEIVLNATDSIQFGAGSTTSISAENQIIPLGVTQGGLEWLKPLYLSGGDLNVGNPLVNIQVPDKKPVLDVPEKKITIQADKVLRDDGAVIDLSGGGDLLAYEFIPGDGGSQDVLNTNQAFAILPGLTQFAPFDPIETPRSGLQAGDSIYISGGSGLAEGEYALLPARYALLPGAFLVTPLAASGAVMPEASRSRIDGAPIVSGLHVVAGTEIKDQRWSEFVIEPGSIAKTRSEYNLNLASQFFADRAVKNDQPIPRLPKDAGQLVFNVSSQLDLPTVRANVADGGRGGLVDIVANNLSVVTDKTGTAGVVELLAGDISNFNVESLLLGAVRTFDSNTGHIRLDVKSESVTIAEDTTVKAPELLLAAKDKVELEQGARIEADGKVADADTVFETSGDGAFLRASAGKQAAVQRTNVKGLKGDLLINEGSVIAAGDGSVLLDSTRQAAMNGQLDLEGGSLSISAGAINLGEVDGIDNGLSLDNSQLSQLTVNELILTSRSALNVYGQLIKTDAAGNPLLDAEGNFAPLEFGDLTIDAAGLSGWQNAGKTSLLNAKSVTLTNSAGVSGSTGTGSGLLAIDADQMILSKGNFKLSGFDRIDVALAENLIGRGEGKITASGDVAITTPYVSAENGAKTTIDTTGHTLSLNQKNPNATAKTLGIGAQLNLVADSIALNTSLLYKTGDVSLDALQGDLALGNTALIDVSGAVANAGLSKPVNVSAGKISLAARQGDVVANAGSKLLLNGVNASMSAGSLSATAANGQVLLNGDINAHGVGESNGGRISVDTGSMAGTGFSAWNRLFADAGFTGGIDLRLRNDDIVVDAGETVSAHAIKLTADNGGITVGGTLDAEGWDGGSIALAAEDALTLNAAAKLLAGAEGADGNGGQVRLESIDRHGNGAGIEIMDGARIDVAAAGNGKEGEVYLRADRLDTDQDGVLDVNIKNIAQGAITGDSDVTVEAVQVYSDSSINTADQDAIKADNQSYMDDLEANNVANTRFGSGFTIMPGVEIDSTGNLTLASAWDLADWRYGSNSTPGVLTLRAANDVLLKQDLSDAFAPGQIDLGEFGVATIDDFLMSGRSWSYHIVAGADLSSADSLALHAGIGDVKLSNNVKVRTGTGDIDVLAGRDIVYGNDNSVIYTAGRPDEQNRWGFSPLITGGIFYAEYPLDGGDITLHAGRDIVGKATTQLTTDWLVRTGDWSRNDNHTNERPTAWGIAFGSSDFIGLSFQHHQSVAAFGGGNVAIDAGRNINDLSVVIPTTGKQVGQPVASDAADNFDYQTNQVEVNGGGNLRLQAGGDIAGGVFHVDGGTADLTAAGSFRAGSNKDAEKRGLNPILALGDARFNLIAGKDIALEAIIDPMILPATQPADALGIASQFFRYSDSSAVKLTSLSGDITLDNDASALDEATNANISVALGTYSAARVYPGTLKAYALNGNLAFNGSLDMYPSPTGQLDLYAANNITGNAIIHLSDADPGLLPSALFPVASNQAFKDAMRRLDSTQPASFSHAVRPVHLNDPDPVLISTGSGNIAGASNLQFVLAKEAEVSAGKDIANASFKIQHNTAASNTVLQAGRDIRFSIPLNKLSGQITPIDQRIEVAGPGQLTLLAGRNIDLGSSQGVRSIGNTFNTALADEGANITALAGLADGQLNAIDFAEKYLANPDKYGEDYQHYLDRFVEEMRILTGDAALTENTVKTAFNNLAEADKARIEARLLATVQKAFFSETQKAGSDHAYATTKEEQDRAELNLLAAIETLFPGSTLLAGNDNYTVDPVQGVVVSVDTSAGAILAKINAALDKKIDDVLALQGKTIANASQQEKDEARNQVRPILGKIALFFSTVQTLDGGDVNLMTPNGGITAGLAADIDVRKGPGDLGIIAQKQGAINAIVRDNFDVNIARVVTLGGDDIMAGSTEGDIDAGRGAKSALSAPAPRITFNEAGDPITEFPPILAGSGIRTVAAPGAQAGDILLFAPRGVIDAGEAGITGNNVTVSATAIVGADNIDVGGVSVGVPVAPTGSIAAGLSNVSNLAASVTNAVESSTNVGEDTNNAIADSALGILSVDLLGFGDCDQDNRENCHS